jgi:hypothetical protein
MMNSPAELQATYVLPDTVEQSRKAQSMVYQVLGNQVRKMDKAVQRQHQTTSTSLSTRTELDRAKYKRMRFDDDADNALAHNVPWQPTHTASAALDFKTQSLVESLSAPNLDKTSRASPTWPTRSMNTYQLSATPARSSPSQAQDDGREYGNRNWHWSAAEVDALAEGVAKYGAGSWAQMQADSHIGPRLAGRTRRAISQHYHTQRRKRKHRHMQQGERTAEHNVSD